MSLMNTINEILIASMLLAFILIYIQYKRIKYLKQQHEKLFESVKIMDEASSNLFELLYTCDTILSEDIEKINDRLNQMEKPTVTNSTKE